jgi:hypothetical protein
MLMKDIDNIIVAPHAGIDVESEERMNNGKN